MQSAGSLKQQPLREKVRSQVALATKSAFLVEEVHYLQEFKEHAEILNQLAKPMPLSSPESQISKLARKMEKHFIKNLEHEVVFTRREISLEQISDDSSFQTKVAQNYEERIEEFSRKLEHMEEVVQEAEERKKVNQKLIESASTSLKVTYARQLMEENILQKEKIKQLLREKLLLSGAIKRIQDKSSHQLIKSKQQKHSFQTFHFLTSHQELYRHPSNDQLRIKKRNSPPKQKVTEPPLPHLRSFYLKIFEREIFTEELGRVRSHNNKMQLLINLLKQSETQREDEKILKELTQEQDLALEQAVAREMFAYQKMSERFQEKLERYSYSWVFQQKFKQGKTSNEQSWERQRLLQNRRSLSIKQRCRSTERDLCQGNVGGGVVQASKSNGRTNCSLSAVPN